MKEYQLHHGNGSVQTIKGDDLQSAIENSFGNIIREAGNKIGNVAGYTLDEVFAEWKPGILGGKGGVELHVINHGSDDRVGYNPYEDAPKDTVFWIEASKDDLPERYTFELTEEKADTPFDHTDNPAVAFGYAQGIIDEIYFHHCSLLPRKDDIGVSAKVYDMFPTLAKTAPKAFIERCRQRMQGKRPKRDAETKKLMQRLDELLLFIYESPNAEICSASNEFTSMIYKAHAKRYFETQHCMTALEYYRRKADLSVAQLAEMVGLSERQIFRYEATRNSALGNASQVVINALANALNVAPTDLVKDRGVITVPDDALSQV